MLSGGDRRAYRLRISEGDLDLRVVRDTDLAELLAVAQAGVHDPGFMPFARPGPMPTRPTCRALPAVPLGYPRRVHSGAVHLNPRSAVVASCGARRQHRGLRHHADRGDPWPGRRFHRRGVARERRAVCAFVFEQLGAVEVTRARSWAIRPRSAVSRKVGYQPNSAGGEPSGPGGGEPAAAAHPRHVRPRRTRHVVGAAELWEFLAARAWITAPGRPSAQPVGGAARRPAARARHLPFFEGGQDDAVGRSVISVFGLAVAPWRCCGQRTRDHLGVGAARAAGGWCSPWTDAGPDQRPGPAVALWTGVAHPRSTA